ncbi:hypothetical protein IE53DRAFT_388489 [Violaceomyces palustris]|uniref:Uncharacterized protein n=1 Tax=Violaceomyces palustris TaxID=1673888 RepID=A0ACD0NU27_9BASI|nr:hypothetical protein IE53DRAFT_388489 [Violaceomyces palustris]
MTRSRTLSIGSSTREASISRNTQQQGSQPSRQPFEHGQRQRPIRSRQATSDPPHLEPTDSSFSSQSAHDQESGLGRGQADHGHSLDGHRAYPHFPGDKPWSQRGWLYQFKPFRGMYYDLVRRKPFLRSDWSFSFIPSNLYTIVSSVVRMYFINLMPAIAYVLDMNYRTGGSYGVNEVILASALAAIVFSVFSVQPLTFVGVTGLINLVNYTQYDIFVNRYGFDNLSYLRVQAWSLIWSAAFHFVIAIFNICDYTRFITDITTQTFGFYVGVVYIQKGIELLLEEFEPLPLDNATGWLSVTIAILFTVSVYFVSRVGDTSYLPFKLRKAISSYAFAAGCIFWTGFSHFPDYSLRRVPIERLPITKSFFPTLERSWFVDFWNIELKYVFVGAPLGFLITLLFYFDHNVSSVMAQARNFPVRTPAGFHWDFFLLGVTTLVSGLLGLPAPNGLVPQAPVHTESLSVYKQVDVVADEEKGGEYHRRKGDETSSQGQMGKKVKSEKGEEEKERRKKKERVKQHVVNVRVAEQRFSHLLVGLLTLGTMTRPLLVVLGPMPRAVFAGVFILVGWDSVGSNGITARTLAIFQDRRMVSDEQDPLLSVRRSKIALYVGIQWIFFAMTMAISQTIAAIGFPVIIILLIPFRYYLVPRWFSPLELKALDAPTADADVVLASLGHETHRVTGRGVEIALDTGIAGDLYCKVEDGEGVEEEEEGMKGPKDGWLRKREDESVILAGDKRGGGNIAETSHAGSSSGAQDEKRIDDGGGGGSDKKGKGATRTVAIVVENPPRGPGNPPDPVQWR